MISGWTVRQARLDEADNLADLESRAFGSAAWGTDAIAQGVTSPSIEALVAVERMDAAPAAFALWRRLGDEAELLTIAVEPAKRRRGAGKALLSAIVRSAVESQVMRIFLEVNVSNASAIALYVDSGFIQIGRREKYYRDGGDALVMRLNLLRHEMGEKSRKE